MNAAAAAFHLSLTRSARTDEPYNFKNKFEKHLTFLSFVIYHFLLRPPNLPDCGAKEKQIGRSKQNTRTRKAQIVCLIFICYLVLSWVWNSICGQNKQTHNNNSNKTKQQQICFDGKTATAAAATAATTRKHLSLYEYFANICECFSRRTGREVKELKEELQKQQQNTLKKTNKQNTSGEIKQNNNVS